MQFEGQVVLTRDRTVSLEVRCGQLEPSAAVSKDRVLLPPFMPKSVSARGVATTLKGPEVPLFEVLEALGDGVWDWDLVSDRVHYSARFMALLGYDRAEAFQANFSFRSHLHAQDLTRVTQLVAHVLQGSEPVFDTTYRLRHVTGQYRWFQGRGVVLRDEQGQARRMVGHLVDIQDRMEADDRRQALARQRQEQSAEAALGQFARGLAPGLGMVASNIQRGIKGLFRELPPPWTEHPLMTDLLRLTDRGVLLGEQLATLAGLKPQRLEVVDLSARLPTLLSPLHALAPPGIGWVVNVPGTPLRVLVDVAQLRLALQAVCTNAWQAMAERDGQIQVSLAPDPDGVGVLLGITDEGAGMSPDVQARAFEPFFSTRAPGQGVGLGLAVVRTVVQGLQGRVTLTSQAGVGSTIRLWLPRVNDVADPAATSLDATDPFGRGLSAMALRTNSASSGLAEPRHVVYVDDYEAMVYLMTRMLTRRGQRVTAFERATDALAYLEAHKDEVDLLVTDYNMPVLSGMDVLRRARALRPDLPVVLTSGHVTPFMSSEAEAEGVLQVLNRQDSVEEQVDTIVALLAALPPRAGPPA